MTEHRYAQWRGAHSAVDTARTALHRVEVRRRVLTAVVAALAILAAADAVQNSAVVYRRHLAALPPGAGHRLAVPHPVELYRDHGPVLRYLDAIGNGERIREGQVTADAARETVERAKQEAAAALAGRPQPWLSAYLAPNRGGYALPTRGVFSSGFGPRWGGFHQGIDIANAIGTPVYSVAAGTVIDAGPASGFGLWVRIRHDDGAVSVYGHLYDFFVSRGERVPAGMPIGRMGNRGDSTGPHLHFEIHAPNGAAVDPLPWLTLRGIRVVD